MRTFLFWPYQLYAWLIFYPLAILLTLVFSLCTVIGASLVNPSWASRTFAATWARLLGWLTPIRVVVEGAEHAEPGRQYVVVSNHQSMYDILVIYGWLKLDLKWVMKQELRKVPAIGIGCEKAGHIYVDRRNPKKARAAINQALQRLGDGVGILFFPEGTRSNSGRLLPFKKGAFRTAIEQNLPVLPVTVIGTRDIIPNKTLKLFPGRARMVIHPAIETSRLSPQDCDSLVENARSVIESALPAELR